MATQTIPTLETFDRAGTGTRNAQKLREKGRIPAVIYGHGQDPAHVAVDRKRVVELLHENAHLIDVQVAGSTEHCLVKDVQWDYLGAQIIHVDLARVDLNEKVTIEVSLRITGDAIGLKEAGAFLEHPVTEIEVECLATDIPSEILLDVSSLKLNETLTVADLKLPEGVVAVTDEETILAAVHVAVAEEEAEAPAVAEGEPQVIGAKDEDEDEDDKK